MEQRSARGACLERFDDVAVKVHRDPYLAVTQAGIALRGEIALVFTLHPLHRLGVERGFGFNGRRGSLFVHDDADTPALECAAPSNSTASGARNIMFSGIRGPMGACGGWRIRSRMPIQHFDGVNGDLLFAGPVPVG